MTVLNHQTVAITSTCGGFQEISVPIALASPVTVPKNSELGIRVTNTGSASVRLAYDVTSTYAASLKIALK